MQALETRQNCWDLERRPHILNSVYSMLSNMSGRSELLTLKMTSRRAYAWLLSTSRCAYAVVVKQEVHGE